MAGPRHLPFVPLRDVEKSVLAALKPLVERAPEGPIWLGNFLRFGPLEAGAAPATYPELVLGADLPKSCIKWTKDIRLLTRGDTRTRSNSRFPRR